MKVERLYTDEKGYITIEGTRIRVKENVCYMNYVKATENYPKVRFVNSVGFLIFLIGLLIISGLIGHSELISSVKIEDTWSVKTYIILNGVGMFVMLMGILVVKWGLVKECIYNKWIEKYDEQIKCGKEAL